MKLVLVFLVAVLACVVAQDKCDICKQLVGVVEGLVAQNSSETEIVNTLKSVCGFLPGDYSKQCNGFVEAYADKVIAFILKKENPEKICDQLTLCTAVAKSEIAVQGGVECELCDLAVNALDAYVAKNVSVEKIRKELGELCNVLPGTAKTFCTDFDTEANVKRVVDYLEAKVSAKKICSMLHLCDASFQLTITPKYTTEPTCSLCKLVASSLETWLASNSTIDTVHEDIEKVCAELPATFKEACQNVGVPSHIRQLVNYVESNYPPETACKYIELC
mmetsp:Transcript_9830/g.10899  ORF Transcript_9830/g.10899 Transcript_9830/m.10899 type:complete len:277 (-) Transcript_9830:44-874(-)